MEAFHRGPWHILLHVAAAATIESCPLPVNTYIPYLYMITRLCSLKLLLPSPCLPLTESFSRCSSLSRSSICESLFLPSLYLYTCSHTCYKCETVFFFLFISFNQGIAWILMKPTRWVDKREWKNT